MSSNKNNQHLSKVNTPPKINIEPENDGLVQMIFQGARILRFPAVNLPGFGHLERQTWSQSASGWKESWRNVKPTEQQRANRWKMRWSWLRTGDCGRLEAPKTWRLKRLQGSKQHKKDWLFFLGRFVGGFLGGLSIFNVLLNDLGLKQRHLLDFEVWMTCVGCKLGPAFLAVVVVSGPIFGAGHTSLSRVRFEVWEQRKLRIFQ